MAREFCHYTEIVHIKNVVHGDVMREKALTGGK
jgi:hypothetical protein